jgi:hypothetical protein
MVKGIAFDAPPPGAGLVTVMLAEPAAARFDPGSWAWSCVGEVKVVASAALFHTTCEEEMKLVPDTVMTTLEEPVVAVSGEMEVIAGTGFEDGEEPDGVPDEELLPPPHPRATVRTAKMSPAHKRIFNRMSDQGGEIR